LPSITIKASHVGLLGALVIVSLALVVGVSSLASHAYVCESDPVELMNIREHLELVSHIHPTLRISILGKAYAIPANIGIASNWMSPIHTHEGTGKLHVEAPCSRDFYLSDFFVIWNKTFNQSCIFEFCMNQTHQLRVTRNGFDVIDPENLVLRDRDDIAIVYE